MGIRVHLHCFMYGRAKAPILETLCEKVFYYRRKQGLLPLLSFRPYIISSRTNKELEKRLLEDTHPLLLEGLHCSAYLESSLAKGKPVVYRESNIEHQYYFHLAKAERMIGKALYHMLESLKLYFYERKLRTVSLILPVSTNDASYFKRKYPGVRVEYLSSFHANDEVRILEGRGSYILYHGNLSVAENIKAVLFLAKNVFSRLSLPVIVAGLDPSPEVKSGLKGLSNVTLIENPDEERVEELIQNAHVHVLYTFQTTGLKLKLLNVLYNGRFCLVNDKMLAGTGLEDACIVENNPGKVVEMMSSLFKREFTLQEIEKRKVILGPFSNRVKAEKLVGWIFQDNQLPELMS